MVLQEYQDPKLSKYLKIAYWVQEHKPLFNNIKFAVITLLVAAIWLNVYFQLYQYFGEELQHEQMIREILVQRIPIAAIHEAQAPDPLVVSDAFVMRTGEATSADFAAIIENTNEKWIIGIEYVFEWSTGETVSKSATIFPLSTHVITARGASVQTLPADATVRVATRSKKRVRDLEALMRLKNVTNAFIVTGVSIDVFGGTSTARYTITNNSIYDILDVQVPVLVYDFKDEPVAYGINRLALLRAHESRTVELRWLYALPTNSAIRAYPLVDVFDASLFRVPAGDIEL